MLVFLLLLLLCLPNKFQPALVPSNQFKPQLHTTLCRHKKRWRKQQEVWLRQAGENRVIQRLLLFLLKMFMGLWPGPFIWHSWAAVLARTGSCLQWQEMMWPLCQRTQLKCIQVMVPSKFLLPFLIIVLALWKTVFFQPWLTVGPPFGTFISQWNCPTSPSVQNQLSWSQSYYPDACRADTKALCSMFWLAFRGFPANRAVAFAQVYHELEGKFLCSYPWNAPENIFHFAQDKRSFPQRHCWWQHLRQQIQYSIKANIAPSFFIISALFF